MVWLQFPAAALVCAISFFGTGSLGTPAFARSAEGTHTSPGFNIASELVGIIRGEEASSSVLPGAPPDFDATSQFAPRALHERKGSSVDGSDFKALDSDVQKLQDQLQHVAQTADNIQGDVAAGTENKRLRRQIAQIQTATDKLIAKSKDFEKEAERGAPHSGDVEEEEDHDDESAADSGESSDWRLLASNPAAGACGALVASTYIWFAYSLLFENRGYKRLIEEHAEEDASFTARAAAFVAFFNYWVAMPLTLLAFSAQATCEGGVPDTAYIVYAIFLSLHMMCAMLISQSIKLPPIFASKIMSSLPVLSFFLVIEHFDMGTDTMFPGSALACNAQVTPLWLHSWRSVPLIGNYAASAFEPMGFGGFALLMFVGGAYIPQMVAMFSLFTFIYLTLAVGVTILWVFFGWIVGLLVLFVLAIGCYCSGLTSMQWDAFYTEITSARSLAFMGGLLIFEDMDDARPEERLLILGMTKLVYENLLQLWIQSSLFSFTFEHMNEIARKKALVSIGLGLAVCFSKVLPACLASYNIIRDQSVPAWAIVGILTVVISAVFATAWIVAKMYFAFACASHVWNLSSGCVPLPPSS